jgi:hypothetical protein
LTHLNKAGYDGLSSLNLEHAPGAIHEQKGSPHVSGHSLVGERDGCSIVTSAQLWVEKGRVLSLETLGKSRSDYVQVGFLFYEVLIERIVEDRVGFAHRNLVIKNPDGPVNLSGPA